MARFTNKTGGLLERGPLAIFTEGAFLGQGMTDSLPDGATATVPFALERTLAVEQDRETREEGARLYHIEAGALTIAREQVTLTQYRLRNGADHEAKLLLKHPRDRRRAPGGAAAGDRGQRRHGQRAGAGHARRARDRQADRRRAAAGRPGRSTG